MAILTTALTAGRRRSQQRPAPQPLAGLSGPAHKAEANELRAGFCAPAASLWEQPITHRDEENPSQSGRGLCTPLGVPVFFFFLRYVDFFWPFLQRGVPHSCRRAKESVPGPGQGWGSRVRPLVSALLEAQLALGPRNHLGFMLPL